MKPREFYEQIQSLTEPELLMLQPMRVVADHIDARAARLMLFILEAWPEMTQGELEELLHTATWWAVFWASAYRAEREERAPEQQELPL